MQHIVDSYNIFINTDRIKGLASEGDKISLNLGHQPIVCGDNEFIRMTLSSFAMRKSWSDINEHNNKFNLVMRQSAQVQQRTESVECILPGRESGRGFDVLYNAICEALAPALAQIPRWELKYPTFDALRDSPEGVYDAIIGVGRLVIILEDQFIKADNTAQRELDSCLPVIQCVKGDSHKLFGGTRIDSANVNLAIDNRQEGFSCLPPAYKSANPAETDVLIAFPFCYSLQTEKFAYLNCSQVNNNIATTSFRNYNQDHQDYDDKVGLESTSLMAPIAMQNEYLYYQANTDHTFFINFTSKQATLLQFSVTDSGGRTFPLQGPTQGRNGNRTFEMTLRVDRIKRTEDHPDHFETRPPAKSTAPRMANAPTQWMSRGVPGYGLNMPGQVLGDGYQPMFEK